MSKTEIPEDIAVLGRMIACSNERGQILVLPKITNNQDLTPG